MGRNFRKIVSLVLTIMMVASMAIVGASAATVSVVASGDELTGTETIYFQYPEQWSEWDNGSKTKVYCHLYSTVEGAGEYSGVNLWGSKKSKCTYDEELGLWGFNITFPGPWDRVIFYVNVDGGPQTDGLAFTAANCTPDDYVILTGDKVVNDVDSEKSNWVSKWVSEGDTPTTDSEVVDTEVVTDSEVEDTEVVTDSEVEDTEVATDSEVVDTDTEVATDSEVVDTDSEVADTDSEVADTDTEAVDTADVPKVYSLVGAMNGWNEKDETTELTLDPETGLYTVALEIETGSYEYKVVADHSWDEAYGAEDGSNLMISVSDTGVVTFTFDPETKAITAEGEFIYEITDHTYRVAGAADLCGSGWDPTDDNNLMEHDEATGLYTKVYTYEAEAEESLEFKVTMDGAKWFGLGEKGEDNLVVVFPADGVYTITVTFDADTNTPDFSVVADAVDETDSTPVDTEVETASDPEPVETETEADTNSDKQTITTETDITTDSDITIVVGSYMVGDVNGDGQLSARDSLMIQQYAAGKITLTDEQLRNATFFEGKLSARSAFEVQRVAAGLTPSDKAMYPVGSIIDITVDTDTEITITTDTEIEVVVTDTEVVDTDSEETPDVPSDVDTDSEIATDVPSDVDTDSEETPDVPSDVDTDSEITSDVPSDVDTDSEETPDVPSDVDTDSEETSDTPDGPAKIYSLAGGFNGWNAEDVAYELVYNPETGLYEITFTLEEGSHEFKVVVDHSWDESYGIDGSNALISVNGDGEVTVFFNAETKEITFTGEYVYEITDHTYRVAGAADLCGSGWDPADDNNLMVLDEVTGLYTKVYTYEAEADESIEFKVTMDGAKWFGVGEKGDDNLVITFPVDGEYEIVITFDTETNTPAFAITLVGDETDTEAVETPETPETPDVPSDVDTDSEESPDVPSDVDTDSEESPDVPSDVDTDSETVETSDSPDSPDAPAKVYSVAGSFNGWNAGDTTTEMTFNPETGLYEVTISVEGKSYAYKVVVDHSLEEAYGVDGADATVNVSEDSEITITFNPETKEVKAEGEFVYEITDHTYRVAGSADLCGSGWDPADDNNVMELDENTGLYTKVYYGYEADADDSIAFKVTMDGTKWFGVGEKGESDVAITFEEAGTYDVVITFNAETNVPSFELVPYSVL